MPEIKDTGKVWIRGKPGTAFAVKVEDKVFVPGQEEGQLIDYWLEGDFLCVDLHNPIKKVRIARQFPLGLQASHPATLFNGFKKTKHADVQVITFQDEGVREKAFEEERYLELAVHTMDRKTFWRCAGLSF
ncbi:MAG: hypothetical protein OEZ51_01325 [Nitrospinota bacterium]|nr:hypothetical protein [Nitrospinota bacterium]